MSPICRVVLVVCENGDYGLLEVDLWRVAVCEIARRQSWIRCRSGMLNLVFLLLDVRGFEI